MSIAGFRGKTTSARLNIFRFFVQRLNTKIVFEKSEVPQIKDEAR